ncbi:MAG: preprotein translocase subunit SecE [Actinomycetota bacterium]|nr:preprotein translocase subunit SecE [Actinomycetota bacterium]
MSMDLNRQQKRAMQKMGEVNEQGAPIRQARPTVAAQVAKERVGPFQYIREVRDEMRKVAWPKFPEVRRYSIIVLVTVVIVTAFVGGLDSAFGILSGWLYKD